MRLSSPDREACLDDRKAALDLARSIGASADGEARLATSEATSPIEKIALPRYYVCALDL
jgi:hypothetical protein